MIVLQRCAWSNADPLMLDYHDTEWGVPLHDDRKLLEFLILEGAQAGLSWSLILKRRPAHLKAFDGFDAHKIAYYAHHKFQEQLANPAIIRNKLKIQSSIQNARSSLQLQHRL